MEQARNALSQNLAQSSLLRPDQSEEAEARLVLRDVIEQHQRHRVNSRQPALTPSQQDALHKRLFDTFFQFGPLQEHLDNPLVEELIVNGPRSGFLLLGGGTKRPFDPGFSSDEEVRGLLSRVVARAGRRIDESSPAVDVRLPEGARLHAILPPLTQHVCLTVRRHRLVADSLDELIELGTVTSEAASFLADSVRGGLNILVSGGTASGKTTTLNALGRAIPSQERIVTVEETIELRLASLLPDCVSLEARSANSEGVGRISIRELVRHALRMRPSRIVVGEVRGAEALDMLSAMNTGHEGSMGTLHANSARQALSKLRTYLLMAEEGISSEVAMRFLTPREIHKLADAIDPRYRALVLVGAYGGLRWGEMAGLRRDRFDAQAAELKVAEILVEVDGRTLSMGPPKTRAGRRTVPIPTEVAGELLHHIDHFCAPDSDLIFAGPEGGFLRRGLFRQRVWLPAIKAAEVDPLRVHDLRHTAIALWIATGAHVQAIKTWAGHSSASVVLDRYGHLFPSANDDLRSGLGDFYRENVEPNEEGRPD